MFDRCCYSVCSKKPPSSWWTEYSTQSLDFTYRRWHNSLSQWPPHHNFTNPHFLMGHQAFRQIGDVFIYSCLHPQYHQQPTPFKHPHYIRRICASLASSPDRPRPRPRPNQTSSNVQTFANLGFRLHFRFRFRFRRFYASSFEF